ncbi:unnamed protein product [Musa acuminata subsp. malaccensis]|uniref:(wild Malaysian banana) hypothetical protein n=1 Tax=Musa acuminata subsp. malaccensis TaxID=214687 RepID=A0A804KMY6_MUSAM|nr:unnamed protein product [Musa acuminata subsp. malaccensis]
MYQNTTSKIIVLTLQLHAIFTALSLSLFVGETANRSPCGRRREPKIELDGALTPPKASPADEIEEHCKH